MKSIQHQEQALQAKRQFVYGWFVVSDCWAEWFPMRIYPISRTMCFSWPLQTPPPDVRRSGFPHTVLAGWLADWMAGWLAGRLWLLAGCWLAEVSISQEGGYV